MTARPLAPIEFLQQTVTLGDITKTVGEWVTERGLNARTVYDRKRRGTPWDEALTKKERGHAMRRGYVISGKQKSPH